MSLRSRIRRLWELSGEPGLTVGDLVPPLDPRPPTTTTTGMKDAEIHFEPLSPVKRMATIVMDDPLESEFPSEDPEHEGDLD